MKKYLMGTLLFRQIPKIDLRMALTITFLIVSLFQVQANSYKENTKLTLNFDRANISEIFNEIESISEFRFLYESNQIDLHRKVTVKLKNEKISNILKILFKGTNIEYKINGRQIILTHKKIQKTPLKIDIPVKTLNDANGVLQNTISGNVADEQGQPLPGASVLEKGTTNGVQTDFDGNFSIDVPKNATLIISYIGFQTQEIAINGQLNISVRMKEDVASLDEIVVVGYGTVKKSDLTGSVGTIDSESLKEIPATTVDQALVGKLAGVQVSNSTGEPGAGTEIRIRGVGSISAGTTPLYVVDGFPVDNIQSLNPNDIESIDVLKDASATAIYGSRGANGIVIISTKRGKAGKSTISLDMYSGFQEVLKVPEFLNVNEQALYYYYGMRNQNLDAGNDVSGDPLNWKINVPKTIMDVLEGRNTTNSQSYDAIFRAGNIQSYNLAAKGGTDAFRYSVSGEYLDNKGIVKGSNFNRYSLRANLDAQLSKNLSMKLNYNSAYLTTDDVLDSGGAGDAEGIIGSATTWQHWYPLLNDDGTYFSGYGQDATNNVWNPVAQIEQIKRKEERLNTLVNLSTKYEFTDDLDLNIMLGANIVNRHYYSFIPKLDVFANVADGADERSSSLNWITESTLNYDKSFGKHSITGLVGFTSQKQKDGGNFLRSRDYPNNLVYTLNATSNVIFQGNSEESEWSLVSYLARVNYNYDSKYYITASIRTDGSSRFGSDKKFGYFPSGAIAWRISKENFLKDVEFINDIKIRASYGETGNNNIGNYAHIATIDYESYPFGGSSVGGYAPSQFANPTLTWEKQRSLNFGGDVSLFNNRISFSADYFKSNNHQLLLNVFVPLITGFDTALQNIGEVENKGWDFTFSSRNFVGDFKWTTDFNISAFENKVLKLGPEGAPIISTSHITQVGQPMGMFYGYKLDGVFMNQAELDAGPIFGIGTVAQTHVGDVRFKDISGPDGLPDGLIDANDKTAIGSPYPDFYYGMTNNFNYKNIGLSVVMQGSKGSKIMNTNDYLWYTRARYKQLSAVRDYWISEAQPGDGVSPRPNNSPTGGVRERSERHLDTGSFFKINNVSLSYTFAEETAQLLSLSSLRIYLTATNPLMVTKFKNFNPEVNTNSNPLQPGIFNYNYPITRSLLLGLNLAF